MAITFTEVTGNQPSGNVLQQINQNFTKIADKTGLDADLLDGKHASELIPGAATFVASISDYTTLDVGRYITTQTRQTWEPITDIGSRTILMEVSKYNSTVVSYNLTYLDGTGKGRKFYSKGAVGAIEWVEAANSTGVQSIIDATDYFVKDGRKIQRLKYELGYLETQIALPYGFVALDNTKTYGVKIEVLSLSGGIGTNRITLCNYSTGATIAYVDVTYSSTISITSTVVHFWDGYLIITASGTSGYTTIFKYTSTTLTLEYNAVQAYTLYTYLNADDNRYENNQYLAINQVSQGGMDVGALIKYNKTSKTVATTYFPAHSEGGQTGLYMQQIYKFILTGNYCVVFGYCEQSPSSTGTHPHAYSCVVYSINNDSVVSVMAINPTVSTTLTTNTCNDMILIGNYLYLSGNLATLSQQGIFKFDITNGNLVSYIPGSSYGAFCKHPDSNYLFIVNGTNSIGLLNLTTFTVSTLESYGKTYSMANGNLALTAVSTIGFPNIINNFEYKEYYKFNTRRLFSYEKLYSIIYKDIGGV